MAEIRPTPSALPGEMLDVLDKHLVILNSHVQFLRTFRQTSKPISHSANDASIQDSDSIEQMITQTTVAIRNTEKCSLSYRNSSSSNTNEAAPRSPATTLPQRTKRASLPSTEDVETDKPAKRRRSSKIHKPVEETWHDAEEHIVESTATRSSVAPTENTPATPNIEYDDITAEVEARLLAKEQRRKLRQQQGDISLNTIKRKRRSTLGDSILGTNPDVDVNGNKNGISKDKARRISAGGTRQIKKLKTRKSNEGSRKSVLPLKSVKLPAEVDVVNEVRDTKEKEKDIAKKRRRSSFVRGQASETAANKFEADDRSTKRRKR